MLLFKSPSPWILPPGTLDVDWSRAPRGLASCFVGNGDIDVAQHRRLQFYLFGGQGTVSVPTPRGNALRPLGSGDYGGSTIQFNPNTGASMEALFLCTGSLTAQAFCNFFSNVFSTGGQGASAAPALGIQSSKLTLYLNSSFVNFSGATTLVVGRVYHAAATWDGSGNCTLYLDGVSDGTSTGTIQSNVAPASFNLGGGYLSDPLSPIIMASCANVQWSADEVKQRFLDPFGFLIPAEGEMPALFTAAEPAGFIPYNPWPQAAPILAS